MIFRLSISPLSYYTIGTIKVNSKSGVYSVVRGGVRWKHQKYSITVGASPQKNPQVLRRLYQEVHFYRTQRSKVPPSPIISKGGE